MMWTSDGVETSAQKNEEGEGMTGENEAGTGGMDPTKLCEGGMVRMKPLEGGMDPTKPDRSGGRMTRMTVGGITTWMTGEGERMTEGMRIGGHHDAERTERIEGEVEGAPGKEGIWVPEEACNGMGKTK